MIRFIIGMMIGGIAGFFTAAILAVGKRGVRDVSFHNQDTDLLM